MNMREDLYRLYSKIDSESIKLDALQVCYLQQVLKIKLHTCYMARSPHICEPPESSASFSVQRTICSHIFWSHNQKSARS